MFLMCILLGSYKLNNDLHVYNIPRRDVFLLLFVHSLVLHVSGGLNIVDYILFQLLGLL